MVSNRLSQYARRLSSGTTSPDGPALGRKFPMYVLPVSDAVQLKAMPVHEDLLASGSLIEWKEGMRSVCFISQTWLRRCHPDDAAGTKWGLLVALLERALSGELVVVPNWASELLYGRNVLSISTKQFCKDLAAGYVWFDYLSVPQANRETQGLAIASIVSYVSDASYFIVLAGAWTDEQGAPRDLRSWLGRGWCRMEQVSNALSLTTKPLIVAQSPSDLQSYGPGGVSGRMWLFSPLGTAAFTVDADRRALGPVLDHLIDARSAAAVEAAASTSTEMVTFRVLRAAKAYILFGTEYIVAQPRTTEDFMAELRFTSAHDGIASGWTPLRLAVLAGRVDVADKLLDMDADVDAPMARDWNEWGMTSGSTVLHLACYVRDDAAMVRLLLSHGANPRHCDASKAGLAALHFACSYGRTANIDCILEHDLTLSQQPSRGTGSLPFAFLGMLGHSAALAYALTHYASHVPLGCQGPGVPNNVCTLAVTQVGDITSLRTLLDAGANHELIGPLTHPRMRLICAVSDVMIRTRKHPRGVFIAMALSSRATALHAAALTGNIGAVNLLLKYGADPSSIVHSHRVTPLHLAAYNGHNTIVDRLLGAGSPASARDSRGRTPAAWAIRRGHVGLAQRLQMSISEVRV